MTTPVMLTAEERASLLDMTEKKHWFSKDCVRALLSHIDAQQTENEQQAQRIERLEESLRVQRRQRDTKHDLLRASERKVERLERTLAAEQGREGLEGWELCGLAWSRQNPAAFAQKHSARFDWRWWVYNDDGESYLAHGYAPSALEAMEAAEAALRGGA